MKQLTAVGRVAKNINLDGDFVKFKLVVSESYADANGEEKKAETVIACVARVKYAYAIKPGACLLIEGNANAILIQKEEQAPISVLYSEVHTLVLAAPGSHLNFIRFNMIGNIGGARTKEVNGKMVCNFTLAHNEKRDDQEVTEWANCALWRELSRSKIFDYLDKGTKVFITGRPIARAYEYQGQWSSSFDITVNTVTLLGGPRSSQEAPIETDHSDAVNEYDDLPF